MLLENGGNLLVLAGTEARDSTVGKGAMQNQGQDSATKVNSGGQYTLGRSKDEFQALARAEDLGLLAGQQSSTQVRWRMHRSVARQEACR